MNIDFSFIKTYCQVAPDEVDHLYLDVPATSLLNEDKLSQLLLQTKDIYEADDFLLPASVIGLSLFGLCGAQWIIQAQSNQELNLSLENIRLQIGLFNNKVPFLQLKVSDCTPQAPTDLVTYVHDHLTAPIELIAKVAGVKPSLIYNQFGARTASLADAFLQHEKNDDIRQRFTSLYEQLQLDKAWRKNPFLHEPVYLDNPYSPGSKMMMRSSCCMFYRKKNGIKCYNCPTLSTSEREKMVNSIQKR